jgi:hypothetical protein
MQVRQLEIRFSNARALARQLFFAFAFLAGVASFCASVFLSWQSLRATQAAQRIDGTQNHQRQPSIESLIPHSISLESLLAEPRNARMWDVLSTAHARNKDHDQAVFAATRAIEGSPAQVWPRMRATYLMTKTSEDNNDLNQSLGEWYLVAPHDGATQPWRLLLAATYWDAITPANRAKALTDAEDLCVRYGRKRTEQLLERGSSAARLAVSSRLGRMIRECVIVAPNLPPLIAQ